MSLLDKIKDNSKQSEGRELYTGVCAFIIDAINPSMDTLKTLGYNVQQEPAYVGEKEGKTTLRLDFYLSNPLAEIETPEGFAKKEIKAKYTIFLEDSEVVNKNGDKKQYINNYGQTTWVDSVDNLPDWFRKDGVRVCHKGEEQLITLLYKWLGLTQPFKDKEGDSCFLVTEWNKLVSGNIKELTELLPATKVKGNGIKVLLGVKEGDKDGKPVYYQDVYSKYIMKPGQTSYEGLTKSLNDEYGQFKSHYNSDLKLRVFIPGEIKPDVEKTFMSTNSAMVSSSQDDELPF